MNSFPKRPLLEELRYYLRIFLSSEAQGSRISRGGKNKTGEMSPLCFRVSTSTKNKKISSHLSLFCSFLPSLSFSHFRTLTHTCARKLSLSLSLTLLIGHVQTHTHHQYTHGNTHGNFHLPYFLTSHTLFPSLSLSVKPFSSWSSACSHARTHTHTHTLVLFHPSLLIATAQDIFGPKKAVHVEISLFVIEGTNVNTSFHKTTHSKQAVAATDEVLGGPALKGLLVPFLSHSLFLSFSLSHAEALSV